MPAHRPRQPAVHVEGAARGEHARALEYAPFVIHFFSPFTT
jgi:hypothetical protein